MVTHHYERSLNLADITLYTISAVLLIDQLAVSVTLGIGSLFWWVVLLLVYLLPSVLVISELGSSFPEQGGIYAWIRSAFGPRWAVRTTWLYWINTALWIPSTFILLTGMFAALFFPEMTIWMRVAMAIGLVWALVWFNIVRLGRGKWLLNLNTYMKFIIFGVLGIGGMLYINAHGSVNELSLETLTPSFDDGLFAIPVIIYGLMGFELVSASSEELKSPEKNIFRATLLSGAIIAGLYFVCVFAVMGVLPAAEIDLGSGLLSTFEKLLGGSTARSLRCLSQEERDADGVVDPARRALDADPDHLCGAGDLGRGSLLEPLLGGRRDLPDALHRHVSGVRRAQGEISRTRAPLSDSGPGVGGQSARHRVRGDGWPECRPVDLVPGRWLQAPRHRGFCRRRDDRRSDRGGRRTPREAVRSGG
jgi:hypothetical protein